MATVLRLTQPWPLLQSLLWTGLPPLPSLGHHQGTFVPLWHHCPCESLLLIHAVLLLQDSSTLGCERSLADCWDHEGTTVNTPLTFSEPHPTTHIQAWDQPHTHKMPDPCSTSFISTPQQIKAIPVSCTPEVKSTPATQSYKHLMCKEKRLILFHYILHLGGQIN